MKTAEWLYNSGIPTSDTTLALDPLGQPEGKYPWSRSHRQSRHVEQNSPAVRNDSQNCHIYLTDIFGFALYFQFCADLK